MPSIDPSLVPTISPGNLFTRFTVDSTLNIRWLSAQEPVYYEVFNRPIADTVLRQLILSKALDNLNVSLGYQAIFPFIVQPQLTSGSTIVNVPVRVFWDFHVSVSQKWANLRLAQVVRLDGENPSGSADYTGTIRFVFTANERIDNIISSSETAIFYVDYEIDSDLTYQRATVQLATSSTVTGLSVISSSDSNTVDGYITMRTLSTADSETEAFYDAVDPGSSSTYEIVDSTGLGSDGDFEETAVSHGTGMLTHSAFNVILPLDSDPSTWVDAFNYPFDLDATLLSNDSLNVRIPRGIFREFNMTAPAGDAPTGDVSGTYYPVWVNRIAYTNDTEPTLTFYFATYSIDPVDPSTAIEFASLTLTSDMTEGQAVQIIPANNLFADESNNNWLQEFGKGHVVLSNLWSASGGTIDTFFNDFPTLVGSEAAATYSLSATRISSYGLSRLSKYTPTVGQAAALRGSSSDFNTPIHPSSSNKYITEKDEGLGDIIDLESEAGISNHSAIERYGNMATSVHKMVKLVINPQEVSDTNDPTFYETQLLPRLRVLLGRDPIFGDIWFQGSRFLTYNGDSWVG